jgi:hypothetical protein
VNRALTTVTVVAASCLAVAAGPSVALAKPHARTAQDLRRSDAVIDWNRFLLDLQAIPGAQPPTVHPTYELAIMHSAIANAVAATAHRGRGNAEVAADAAAHETLVALYPSRRSSIDSQYASSLLGVPPGLRRGQGVRAGQRAAQQLLRLRANDGSQAAPLPFTPGAMPGDYQLTPPSFVSPQFTHWGLVTPFVLRSAAQFRPPAPPPLGSPKSVAALEEVRTLGSATGSTRTADQTQIGLFWNPPIWASWNRIAQTAALAHSQGLVADARTFATLNLAFADAVIAFYDAKYAYRLWRPVTAIRATSDPGWTPLSNTAPDPSYPGAHGTISAAAETVLAAVFGNDFAFSTDSTALSGVLRTYVSFSEAAQEASTSRIYNGNHTRVDQVAGENLGRDVAELALDRQAPGPW